MKILSGKISIGKLKKKGEDIMNQKAGEEEVKKKRNVVDIFSSRHRGRALRMEKNPGTPNI